MKILIILGLLTMLGGCSTIHYEKNYIKIKSFGITKYNDQLSVGYMEIEENTIEQNDSGGWRWEIKE